MILENSNDDTQTLKQHIAVLSSQLDQTKKKAYQLEHELDRKDLKYCHDVELGKQRENKLMFFLYVLKEEKNCPVTEVFENYIRPIETTRFTADYGDDYRNVLKKIKAHAKYEKIFNRALRKMKQLANNREYKSDSCLPVNDYKRFEMMEAEELASEMVSHEESKRERALTPDERFGMPVAVPVRKGDPRVPSLDLI